MLSARRAPGSLFVLLMSLGLAVAVASCGVVSADDDDTGGQNDGAVFDPNTLEGGIDQPPVDPNCHEQTFEPEKIGDPDILIVFDKSGSMSDGSKYSQTCDAVTNAVTSAPASQIHWGLIFFPSDGACGVGTAPDVDVGPDGASQIPSVLSSNSPNGNTPAHKAIELAIQSYNLLVDDRVHYILLATDGMPNCEGDAVPSMKTCTDDTQCGVEEYCEPTGAPPPFPAGMCMPKPKDLAIGAIALALQYGIKTYVVGMDIDSGVADTLNRMAEAGGTARPGDPKYYPVSDQASLEQALSSISMQIISCTFNLDQQPPQPEYIGVTVGGQSVSRDATQANGWDVDANARTLTFYGEACAALQANPAAVSVTFACSPIE
ncbi:MAG: VWA domain-containing protein [Deltaproteobacteria bacterium]|nr:VWA domain-containing protein [Deltaproteobacteria bacterium]